MTLHELKNEEIYLRSKLALNAKNQYKLLIDSAMQKCGLSIGDTFLYQTSQEKREVTLNQISASGEFMYLLHVTDKFGKNGIIPSPSAGEITIIKKSKS